MDFVRWCLNVGFGGWVLLALIAAAALIAVMAVSAALMQLLGFGRDLGSTFVEGYRETRFTRPASESDPDGPPTEEQR